MPSFSPSSSKQPPQQSNASVNLVLLTDSHHSVRVAVSLSRALYALHMHQHHHDEHVHQQHEMNPSSSSSISSSSANSNNNTNNCPPPNSNANIPDNNPNTTTTTTTTTTNSNPVHCTTNISPRASSSSCTNIPTVSCISTSLTTTTDVTHPPSSTPSPVAAADPAPPPVVVVPSSTETNSTTTTATITSTPSSSLSSSSSTSSPTTPNNTPTPQQQKPPPSPSIHIHLHVPAPFACSVPSPRHLPAQVHVHVHSVPSSRPFMSPSFSTTSIIGKTGKKKHSSNKKHACKNNNSSSTSFKSAIALATQLYFHPSCTLFDSPLLHSSSSSSTNTHFQTKKQQEPVHGIITTPGCLLAAMTLSELHTTPSSSSISSPSSSPFPSEIPSPPPPPPPIPVFLLSDVPHLRTAHYPSIALTSTLSAHAARVIHTTSRRLRAGRRPLRTTQEDLAVTHIAQQRNFYSRYILRKTNSVRCNRLSLKPINVLEILDCLFAKQPVTVVLPAPRTLIPSCPDWPVSDLLVNNEEQIRRRRRRRRRRRNVDFVDDDDDTTVSAVMTDTSSLFMSNAAANARLNTHGYARFRNGFHATIVRAPPIMPAMHASEVWVTEEEDEGKEESERIRMKNLCEKERVKQSEKLQRQGLQRGQGRNQERRRQNNNTERDENINSDITMTTTTTTTANTTGMCTTQQQQQQQKQQQELSFCRPSFAFMSKSISTSANNNNNQSTKSKSFSCARLQSPSFSHTSSPRSPRSHSFFSPSCRPRRATTSKSYSMSYALRDRLSIRLISSTNIRPISMTCPIGHVRIGLHLSSLTALYTSLTPSSSSVDEKMTFPKKSACTPLSVKKLLRCIRNMVSSHAEVLISIPSSAVPLNCTKRNGKEGTNVAYQGVSECVLTKYVGDTEMNDWVRNHVRFVNAADFVALIPSLTTLISDGDPALCVHALSVHVPIVGVIHVSHGVSLGKTNDITMNNNTSSNKAMRTFWIHLIHMYLNSFSTSSSTTRSIITTTHNSHAFELSLQHALAGGCSYQVNDIAVQLKQERELCLRWHRARQRYVMLMKDGIGSRMCDYECDWLNDEIERVGDGAVVVARAVLDRVGVRPSKPTRPTRTS